MKLFKVERITKKVNFIYAENEKIAKESVVMSTRNEEAPHHFHISNILVTELHEKGEE
jgi:hypothetical protein